VTARGAAEQVLALEHADVLRESVALMVREMMEAEIAQLAGAELGERAPGRRAAQRNGYRERRWDTRVGEIELEIPRLRPLEGDYPYLWLDAKIERVREPGGVRQRRWSSPMPSTSPVAARTSAAHEAGLS
jgi:transposase-like protein